MPAQANLIAWKETDAAAAIGLSRAHFRKLVSRDALPPPVVLPDGTELWMFDDLRAILNGEAAKPNQGFEI
ncbi:helix-turn-helix transcriptional regulator [Shimia sp. MIT910701]|uniref:helix-turn-helix transcriptional regulator n=1 Tax=Shimia sp. MIT910701 TaxID=3096987 RepID=UPI00399BA4D0